MKRTWDRPELNADGLVDPSHARISRRASLLRGAMGFAGMMALVGCAAGEGDSLDSTSLEANGDIGSLLEGQTPMVAGETLDAELLRRFYVRRGFEPVWNTRQAQANGLKAAVLRARDHGLDPEMFFGRTPWMSRKYLMARWMARIRWRRLKRSRRKPPPMRRFVRRCSGNARPGFSTGPRQAGSA